MPDRDVQSRETPRRCHFCTLPIPDDEKAVHAQTGNALAHFECWYDGVPIERDHQTGRQSDAHR